MSFWIAAVVLLLAALLPLLWPLLRPPQRMPSRVQHDLAVYREQLAELDSEAERGEIAASEAAEARREIQRRILRAAGDESGGDPATTAARPLPSAVTAVVVALLVPAAALLLYLSLGRPTVPGQPVAARPTPPPAAAQSGPAESQAPSLARMVERLNTRLAADPENVQDWVLLGRTQWELGQPEAAADAYGRAVALNDRDASLQVAHGEALMASAQGVITPQALVAFKNAHALDAGHPGARFYLGLADVQAGRPQAAYERWLGVARELPAGSPARNEVVRQLQALATNLGLDLAADLPEDAPAAPPARAAAPAPGPSAADVAAAAEMSDDDRANFIRSMVARLAERLEEQPDDYDGWMRLGRAYGVLGDRPRAADAYGRAAALRPTEAAPLEQQAMLLLRQAEPGAAPPPDAIAVLERLAVLAPDHPRALWYLGLADVQAGRLAEAIDKWQRLRAYLPADSEQRRSLDAGIARLQAQLDGQ